MIKLFNLYEYICQLIKHYLNSRVYKDFGPGSIIGKQLILTHKSCISIGKSVMIYPNNRLELIKKYSNQTFLPELIVGDFSQIHQNCHITCADKIELGQSVIIVSNVTITDIIHPYDDISMPINASSIITKPVKIGDETYIYNNSVILPGTTIGRHCVIGANSVVNSNIPDYSIAVGNPARVVKQYNFVTKNWEKI